MFECFGKRKREKKTKKCSVNSFTDHVDKYSVLIVQNIVPHYQINVCMQQYVYVHLVIIK